MMRGESARPGKRPLRALSASEKMDAIQRVHEGESKASVARDIGVPESTLRGWCKSEHKIRGMARNSSTPDSEAHSPASSSGTNNINANNLAAANCANLSSEDESPCAKKAKVVEQQNPIMPAGTSAFSSGSSENLGVDLLDTKQQDVNKTKMEYANIMATMAKLRTENNSLLLQQLGLLPGSTNTLAKNMMGIASVLPQGSTVGLVENGLQYTKNNTNIASNVSNGGSNRRQHTLSAIAPAQIDSVSKSCSRKLQPAAEAPSTPIPMTPRKSTENNGVQRTRGKKEVSSTASSGESTTGTSTTNSVNKKIDQTLWLWLTHQQQIFGQQSATLHPNINHQDGSWFWQWYKRCGFPMFNATQSASSSAVKRSPSKTKAVLDHILFNNINNRGHDMDEDTDDDDLSLEEAIEHAEIFFRWLDKCSLPAVSRLQILQFKYMLDNLKYCSRKTPGLKKSRK